jgi:hypothetical protein
MLDMDGILLLMDSCLDVHIGGGVITRITYIMCTCLQGFGDYLHFSCILIQQIQAPFRSNNFQLFSSIKFPFNINSKILDLCFRAFFV